MLLAGCGGEGLVMPAPEAGGVARGAVTGSVVDRALADRDRELALAAEYRALEFTRAGRPVAWRNEKTGHSGEVVVGPGYRVNALDCRDYSHTIRIDDRRQTLRGAACRQPNETWRVVN